MSLWMRETNAITLNAAEIEFVRVLALTGDSPGMSQSATVSLDAQKEQATFTFARALPAGQGAAGDCLYGNSE